MSALAQYNDMPAELDALSKSVVDSVFSVHKELGPGYLERIYEEALISEFEDRGISYERQKLLPVFYKKKLLPINYQIDLVVEEKIILELKTVEKIIPVHEAQILSYMKQSGVILGFIVNFNEALIKNGLRRIVLSEKLRSFASSR